MKKSVAVIGSGIAGMAAAYYLRNDWDVTLFDKNDYSGGHTNTVIVNSGGKDIPIDTGFMVFNETTYPNLIALFQELGVTSYDTSMSFGVRNAQSDREYACSGFSSFFAQRSNLLKLNHWKLYRDILAFFKAADALLAKSPDADYTLADFTREYSLSNLVVDEFILPMAGAIWSTSRQEIEAFSALSLIRFMKNHQMLGVGIQLQWKTVEGGSNQYKQKLLSQLPRKTVLNSQLHRIGEDDLSAYAYNEEGKQIRFDKIIIATHADQALKLLDSPNHLQQRLLSAFTYNKNHVALHSDSSVMPQSRKAWASWNVLNDFNSDGTANSSTHYWMNRLQNLDTETNFFVSVDYQEELDPKRIHWQTQYEHPQFKTAAIEAQKELPVLNANSRIQFCGSYFRHGFHEDALWSALQVVGGIQKEKALDHEFVSL